MCVSCVGGCMRVSMIVAVLLKVYEQVDGNSRLQVGTG